MRQRFVVRLMGPGPDDLLAWAEVFAAANPPGTRNSCPFMAVPGVTRFGIERSGQATRLLVHWCDLDVVRERAIEATDVAAGQAFDFVWFEPVWLVPSPAAGVTLPGVTVRGPVAASPPVGVLVGRGTP